MFLLRKSSIHFSITTIVLLMFLLSWMIVNTPISFGQEIIFSPEEDFLWEPIEGGVKITGYEGTGSDIVIPETFDGQPVLEIDRGAFSRKNLTSVVLPDTLTYIGIDAFMYNQLNAVIIPESVTAIGSFAFYSNSIEEIIIPEEITILTPGVFGYNQISSLIIPENVIEILSIAFVGNELTEITIPSNVQQLNHEAFADNNISKVTLESSNLSISVPYRRQGPFANNPIEIVEYGIKVTTIPNNFLSDADLSGANSSNLISNDISTIGSWSFWRSNLSELKLPDSIKKIGASAFSFNELTEIVIPGSVEEIGNNAFIYNEISSAVIPGGVNIIGSNAFANNQEEAATLTIYGELNSAAADYANSHGHTFKHIDDLVQYYSVYYRSMEHVSGAVPKDENLYGSGTEVIILGNSGNLRKYGYTFSGWNTKEDGSGTFYSAGSSLIIGSESIVLFAQWEAASENGDTTSEIEAIINPQTLLAAVDLNFSFTAAASKSELDIVSYSWSFGDGTTGTGVNPSHTYNTPGEYQVTLTIQDSAGNISSVTKSIKVIDIEDHADKVIVSFEVVDAVTTDPVSYAELKVENDVYDSLIITDENGLQHLVMAKGSYQVTAVAEGYMPRMINIETSEDNKNILIGLSSGRLVTGEFNIREMTYDEIIEAGIDGDNPDNQHVYKFKAEFEFIAGPKIYTMPVVFFQNGQGDILSPPLRFEFAGSGDGGGGGRINEHLIVNIFPISERFFLVIYGEARWLKEMFNVELVVINHSAVDWIEDCSAELILPEGLSLASMISGEQDLKVDLGTITENSNERANWHVRGDKEGDYHLAAEVNGTFMPNPEPFNMFFETEEPIRVYAGSALKLTITAPSVAYRGERYHVLFELENVSDKTLYNISFGITGTEQFQVLQIADNESIRPLDEEDFGDSMTKSIESLYPGEKFVIDFSTTIWFESILEFSSIDIAYYLTNVFITALEGSTTEIPYEIVIKQAPHSSITNKLAKEVFKYGVKVLSKGSIDYDVIEGAYQIYKYNKYGANSKATITVIQGNHHFLQGSQHFGNNDNHGKKVIDVTTTSPNQIIEGNSIIINEEADIIVDFVGSGEATLIIELDDDGEITTFEIPYSVDDVELDLNHTINPIVNVSGSIAEKHVETSSTRPLIDTLQEKEKATRELYPTIYFESSLTVKADMSEQDKLNVNKNELVLPGELINALINETWAELHFSNHIASLLFDRNTISAIKESLNMEDDLLKIETELVDNSTLSEELQNVTRSRPVYKITAQNKKGPINEFGDGKVTVSIPYKLGPNEVTELLYIYHLNDQYEKTVIDSSYDIDNELIIFETGHFSYFVIGYYSDNDTVNENHNVKLSANPQTGGEVKGAGIYLDGELVTITAIPNTGYLFNYWSENDQIITTDIKHSFNVYSERNFIANFSSAEDTYKITVKSKPTNGGTISTSLSNNKIPAGTVVSLKATANTGFTFAGWETTAGIIADEKAIEATLIMPSQETTVTAVFVESEVPIPIPQPEPPLDEDLVLGDVTGDGSITVNDVALVMRYVLKKESLNNNQKNAADVNSDGVINILDVVLIMRFSLNFIDCFN